MAPPPRCPSIARCTPSVDYESTSDRYANASARTGQPDTQNRKERRSPLRPDAVAPLPRWPYREVPRERDDGASEEGGCHMADDLTRDAGGRHARDPNSDHRSD